jgi:hypothetical protein
MAAHGFSQRHACGLLAVDPKTVRRAPRRGALIARCVALCALHRPRRESCDPEQRADGLSGGARAVLALDDTTVLDEVQLKELDVGEHRAIAIVTFRASRICTATLSRCISAFSSGKPRTSLS